MFKYLVFLMYNLDVTSIISQYSQNYQLTEASQIARMQSIMQNIIEGQITMR
ncbi:hypothetical protein SAMN03080602_01947 [Arenibacter troitsensis]|uniref:Uncharacterized protein n=1 Tax=Arenibacter troitsensis TaxID=188872 RepID=A0A1X7JJZ0_9FLAO|nr:hypothetical protein SAMN03080602_01947 [Arenibacter troitsensis]